MSRRKLSEGCLTIFRYIYTHRGKNTLRTASTRSKYIFQFSSKFFRKGVDMCFRVCYNINIPWRAGKISAGYCLSWNRWYEAQHRILKPLMRIGLCLKWLASTKTHLRSKVVKEKTKKPIIMRHWWNWQTQETQNLPVEIPYRFKSDMPHQLEIIKQIVFGDI